MKINYYIVTHDASIKDSNSSILSLKKLESHKQKSQITKSLFREADICCSAFLSWYSSVRPSENKCRMTNL